MAVYRPTYKDRKAGKTKQQNIWWYHFTFAGRRIQESSKSPRKTVAIEAEKNRRRELERTFNSIEDNARTASATLPRSQILTLTTTAFDTGLSRSRSMRSDMSNAYSAALSLRK